MSLQPYAVTFIEGEDLLIYAETPIQALFLACAMKINNKISFGVDSILEVNTKRFFVSKKENLQNLLKQVK